MRVAFQGELGANGNIVALTLGSDVEPVPQRSFEDVFQAISEGRADLGVIPIENSTMGRIADIHHLLPESDLHIVGEYFQPVHFQLMTQKGTPLHDIKTVMSQGPALSQCRKTIKALNLATREAYDTAGSAKMVAEGTDKTIAALAPRLAADIYGLEILKEDVEDIHDNTTRFLVMSTKEVIVPAGIPATTTFIFRVKNIPAALYKTLGCFATNGLNLTKIESYQLDGSFTATQFYIDVEGNVNDDPLKHAFEELKNYTTNLKILGCYPRDQHMLK